ncbi:hypothetical protein VTO42DRAFT_1126 [Malbranchea cinnamomea]
MALDNVNLEILGRKKFKASELPISTAQRAAVDSLLCKFKKRGGFDITRKQIWAGFNESEAKSRFTASLNEMAESEIQRDPSLLSRERGKAATLIEGAVDRSDLYKDVERALDAISSLHLNTVLTSLRNIRRQEVGEEAAAAEQRNGEVTDERYEAQVRAKRKQREHARRQELEIKKQKAAEEAKAKAEEQQRQRELRRQKEEELRKKQKEQEDQRRAERKRLWDEQGLVSKREEERESRYERRNGDEGRHREDISNRDDTEFRENERGRTWRRYRDRGHSRDRSGNAADGLNSRSDSRNRKRQLSASPKHNLPLHLDEKSLEDAALELLLKEGKELAERSRQKPEFDFEKGEVLEDDQAIPLHKLRTSGTDGKSCRVDQPPLRRGSPPSKRDHGISFDEIERESVSGDRFDHRQDRDYKIHTRMLESRDPPSHFSERALRRDRHSGESASYPTDRRNERGTYNRTDPFVRSYSRSRSRSAPRSREHGVEKSRDRADKTAQHGDQDKDRTTYPDRCGVAQEKSELESDRARYRYRDWHRSGENDRGRGRVGNGDHSYRPQHYSHSPSCTVPSRYRSHSEHRSRSRSPTRRSVRNDIRSDSHLRRRSTSRGLLDIDRYVPPTSNRSRSPKRRDRDRDERARYSEIDRYVPGDDRYAGRGRHTNRESTWRRSRSP